MQGENRGQNEGFGAFRPLRKAGLETPLIGRFWGENRRLVFAPPSWYTTLVALCLIGGFLGWLDAILGWGQLPYGHVLVWAAPAVFLAGVWAVLSMEYAAFDLRARTYFRRESHGLLKRTRRGSITDLDAVVLYCEKYPLGSRVVYRTVIHWKQARVPLLLTERVDAALRPGAPLNDAAGPIAARALRYSQELGVPFYDNSYFHSPPPQPAL